MYQPVRPRAKKTDIIRSRNGCKGCRQRRTKCDEQKPSCGTCTRLSRPCEALKPELKFYLVTGPKSRSCSSNDTHAQESEKSSPTSHISDETSLSSIQLPRLDVIRSLQHTERDVFYSTYWEDACLPAIHPMFISASSIGLDNSMLKDAILALASCNISRRHAEKKSTSRENMGAMGPSLVHQTRSQLYYSSSIKKFISLTPMDYQSNSNVIFTVLVLFAYIESSMGNFEGFYCHVQGLAKFLMDLEAVIGGATLRPLLAAWMQVRFLVWWARAYFSSIEVHRQLPSIPLPKMLEGIAESLEERRVGILSIMCESHRLNFKEALNYWPHSPGREDTAREDINGASELRQTIHLLSVQAKRSDQWLLSLPESEQPLHWVESQHCFEGLGEINEPIIFQSHDAALNFAYFVVGRIMQCTTTLRRLQNPNLEEELSNEEESWARILIQIAKATNMKTSIIKNTYTIGFSGLLLAAISRFQSLELGIEIENWLRELKDMHPTEEGAFPVYQSLGVVKAINQQRMMGCQIFGVTQQVDDGGGNPKFTAYNSQFLNTVLVHGRCTFTGQLFTKCVSIDL